MLQFKTPKQDIFNDVARAYRKNRRDPWVKWRLRRAMTVVVNYWRMAVVGKTPRRTGALQRSIYGKVRVPGGRIIGIVGSDLKHAVWMEYGTKPHIILPRRAKALRFIGRDGQVVFARRVNHPGTKPRRMFERGGQEARPFAVSHLRKALRDVAYYIARRKEG